MANGCKISVTTTAANAPALQRRLNQTELQLLRNSAANLVKDIKDHWVGWRYAGTPVTERGRSRAGWKYRVTSNTEPVTITILNEAVDYRHNRTYYVEHIRRSSGSGIEWQVQIRRLEVAFIPQIYANLTAAIQAAINTPGIPRVIRPAKAGRTVRATLT
jgi:hypothetical protein